MHVTGDAFAHRTIVPQYTVKGTFEYSYKKKQYDGVFIFFPTEKYVKLNNFKGYAKSAGEDLSILTNTEWNNSSTPSKY